MGQSQEAINLKKALELVLNQNGYSFQYSILQRISELSNHWKFHVSEFPIEINGRDTRIDFVLIDRYEHKYLLCECKRVNPALSNWCFVKSPFIRQETAREKLIIEKMSLLEYSSRPIVSVFHDHIQKESYHIAFEIKSDKKGDVVGSSGRDTIEKACGQIILGLNGMVKFFDNHLIFLEKRKNIFLIPVVFTTADIWVSNVDLRQADINTGEIELDKSHLQKKDWVLYQYHTSPGLKHDFGTNTVDTLTSVLMSEYVRTIAIVSPNGIDEFLNWASCIDIN